MNPVLIDLGFIQIYWYSLTMLIAILTGSYLFYRQLKKQNFSDDFIINLLFYAIIFGIIGARVYYVIFNLSYYIEYPIEIFEVWNGGLAIHGAILGGFLFLLYYCKKHSINLLKITDCAAVSVIISQAIGRWGNFFNQEAHGGITTLANLKKQLIPNFIIKGMNINNNYYIPTFYYESIWNILGFIFLIIIKKYYKKLKIGQLTGIYFMWYSLGRFFIESMRTDSLMLGNIRMAMLISILLFIIGAVLVFYKRKDTRVKRLKEKGEVK